jgi:hypothetical protein
MDGLSRRNLTLGANYCCLNAVALDNAIEPK